MKNNSKKYTCIDVDNDTIICENSSGKELKYLFNQYMGKYGNFEEFKKIQDIILYCDCKEFKLIIN